MFLSCDHKGALDFWGLFGNTKVRKYKIQEGKGGQWSGIGSIPPKVAYIIYKAYVLPRMLCGLETIYLNKTQLQQMEKCHLRTLRQIQSLPQRTATSAVFMLLGALPIEAEIHRKQLSLLHSVINSNGQELVQSHQR